MSNFRNRLSKLRFCSRVLNFQNKLSKVQVRLSKFKNRLSEFRFCFGLFLTCVDGKRLCISSVLTLEASSTCWMGATLSDWLSAHVTWDKNDRLYACINRVESMLYWICNEEKCTTLYLHETYVKTAWNFHGRFWNFDSRLLFKRSFDVRLTHSK